MLIKEVFAEFLKEQKERLSPKTYKEYTSIIELFEDSLDGYAWNNLDDNKAYDKAQEKKLAFMDIYDHTYLWDNVGEFLDYFIHPLICGKSFIGLQCNIP